MRFAAMGLTCAVLAFSDLGQACPCRVPGSDTVLTEQTDTWGVRLAESEMFGGGRFDARGEHTALADDEHRRRYELSALVAFRPVARLELSGVMGYFRDSQQVGDVSSSLRGLTDSTLRIRYEAVDEVPTNAGRFPWPALALMGSIRIPTAVAGSSSDVGLGAWELAQGLSLERSATSKLRFGVTTEVGVRSADTSQGVERRLGPRSSTHLTAWYWLTTDIEMGLSSSLIWEGDRELAGERRRETAMLRAVAGAEIAYRTTGPGFEPAFSIRYAPPLHGLVVNATTSTTIELSLGYAR
jgi:hypothetical protein